MIYYRNFYHSESNSYQGYRVWDSACGGNRAKGYKPLWVVDVDSKDPEYLKTIITLVNECRGEQSKVSNSYTTWLSSNNYWI